MTKQLTTKRRPATKGSKQERRRAEISARIAELQRLSPEIVKRPEFAAFKASQPVTAALVEALARRERAAGATKAAAPEDAGQSKLPEGGGLPSACRD